VPASIPPPQGIRDRRQVDPHVEGRAAHRRLREQRRDARVRDRAPVPLLGRGLRELQSLYRRAHGLHRDFRRASVCVLHRAFPGRPIRVRCLRHPHRSHDDVVRFRVRLRELEEPPLEGPAARLNRRHVRLGGLVSLLPHRQIRDHPRERSAQGAADGADGSTARRRGVRGDPLEEGIEGL